MSVAHLESDNTFIADCELGKRGNYGHTKSN